MPDDETYRHLLRQTGEFAATRETVSPAAVQRHVRVGWARAVLLLEDLEAAGAVSEADERGFRRFLGTPCRHCGGALVACGWPCTDLTCNGWKHAALLTGSVGSHQCEGRSVMPSGEPKEEGP